MTVGQVNDSDTTGGRRLGTSERFYWLFDRVSCTNFVVVAEFEQLPPREPLIRAIDSARRRHPLLGMRFAIGPDGAVRYEPGPDRSVAVPVLQGGEPAWRAEITRQLGERFVANEFPLLRCQAFPAITEGGRSAIVFTFHHGITDAGAATRLVEEVLTDALLDLPVDDTAFPSRPPQEVLYPAGYRGLGGWVRRLFHALSDWLEGVRKGKPRLLVLPEAAAPDPPLLLETVRVPRDRMMLLRHRCRSHETTIQGVLGAVQLIALAEELHGDEVGTEQLASAVGMRERLTPPVADRELGMYISMVLTRHRLEPSRTPWELAREVKVELQRRLARGDAHLLWAAFPPDSVFPPDDAGAQRLGQAIASQPMPSVLTNIGRVGPEAGTGPIKALHFAMAPHPGCALVSAVSSYRGALVINCTFAAAHLDAAAAARVAARIGELIEEMCGSG